jgi:hypothetical protein
MYLYRGDFMNKYLKYSLIATFLIVIAFYSFLTYDFLYGELGARFVFWNEAEYYLIEMNPICYQIFHVWLGF